MKIAISVSDDGGTIFLHDNNGFSISIPIEDAVELSKYLRMIGLGE